tara:strand:- start:140 stop:508 length:369 start_codon:yes stop_codon:yes gene_type:complete
MALLTAFCAGVNGFFVNDSICGLCCSALLLSLTAASATSSSRALGLVTGIGGRILLLNDFNVLRSAVCIALLRFSVALVASIITLASVALAITVAIPVVVTAALARTVAATATVVSIGSRSV